MSRLYVDVNELRRNGWSEPMIRTFQTMAEFVSVQSELEQAQTDITDNAVSIAELSATTNTLSSDVSGNSSAISSLDSRLDAYDALAPFVRQGQSAAPAYTPYVGQDASAAYVEVEAQATDDAVVALGAAVGSLITALQTANVLT